MTKDQRRSERTIRLSARERRTLEELLRGREPSARVRVRARILLLSHEDWDRESIATATGSSTSTVGRVRRRYCEEGLKAALSERSRPGGRPSLNEREKQRVVALAEKRGVTPSQVALAWLLHQQGVTAPIVGASKLSQLDEAITALELELDEAERQQLEEPYRPRPDRGFF